MKIAPEDQTAVMQDIMIYGNAFVHLANIDGELVARRLNPLEVRPDLKLNERKLP